MGQILQLKDYLERSLAGLTPAETREFKALDQSIPSLADWDAYTMQPISENERRWVYLFQRHTEAMEQATGRMDAPRTQKQP
jgi:hypothetical protein